jgi:hypothetical protein
MQCGFDVDDLILIPWLILHCQMAAMCPTHVFMTRVTCPHMDRLLASQWLIHITMLMWPI